MSFYKFSPSDAASLSLNVATTGVGRAIAFNDCRQVNWLIEGIGVITSGTVVVESAHAESYTGVWNELDTIDATTLSGGKLYGNTFPHVPGGFVRIRISADIQGGGAITGRLNGLLG